MEPRAVFILGWMPPTGSGSRAGARARPGITININALLGVRVADHLRDFLLPVELLSAPPDLLRRQAFEIRIVELPRRFRAPAQLRLDGGARRGGRFEHPQR